jgi:hypothetical protein
MCSMKHRLTLRLAQHYLTEMPKYVNCDSHGGKYVHFVFWVVMPSAPIG